MPPRIKKEGGPPAKRQKSDASESQSSTQSTSQSSNQSSNELSESDVEKLFFDFCKQSSTGGRQDAFMSAHPNIRIELLGAALNKLLKSGSLTVMQDADGANHFMVRSQDEVKKLTGLSREELIIYQLVGSEGNKGLWIRDIRRRSALPQLEVAKILKALENRRLIKAEKSIEGKNKKVYMLYELEPAKEVRGNSWYTGSEFDSAFIEALRETAIAYIKDACEKKGQTGCTAEQVSAFLRMTGAFAVECTVEEIEMILTAMCHDMILRIVKSPSDLDRRRGLPIQPTLYAPVFNGPYISPLAAIPCMQCPVAAQCQDAPDATISPHTCQYYQEWLDF